MCVKVSICMCPDFWVITYRCIQIHVCIATHRICAVSTRSDGSSTCSLCHIYEYIMTTSQWVLFQVWETRHQYLPLYLSLSLSLPEEAMRNVTVPLGGTVYLLDFELTSLVMPFVLHSPPIMPDEPVFAEDIVSITGVCWVVRFSSVLL